MRRWIVSLVALVCALIVAAPASAAGTTPDPPLHDADYFAFADHVVDGMEHSWNERKEMYTTGARSIDTIANSALLTVFATAAAHGHVGPARNDARARIIARRLTASPPYYTAPTAPRSDKMFHSPGWTSNMEGPYVDMDKSIDPKVAEGLQIAYRARDVLGLDPDTANAIKAELHAVSHAAFFRYPLVRLNQINWPAELYAYDWLVNGDPGLLRADYREHVHRFVDGFKRPCGPGSWSCPPTASPDETGATNVGPSYRFIYQNNASPSYARNLDSAEYANMTLHFIYWYDSALAAGMRPLPHEDMRRLRGWTQRVLYGYWTHAGFMNWDTGWSYERWMKGKAWAYGQQGLLAIATSPRFRQRKAEGAYAKYLFDRGLKLYEHLGEQPPGHSWRPSAQLYGIGKQGGPATKMFWARMAANAARAVSAGMGELPAKPPPPFYAYDADIGRLAVSTPHYSTAILAVNRGKVPYGGLDLARLYDADGDPISGTGGRPPAAFGAVVTTPGGHRLLATQTGLHHDPKRPPLTLVRSPHGRVTHQRRLATHPDAGPFRHLEVHGTRKAHGVRATSRYSFGERSIYAHWTFTRTNLPESRAKTRKGRRRARRRPVRPYRVRLQLPTSGRNAVIGALLRSGSGVALTPDGPSVRLHDVRRFHLRGSYGSYRVQLHSGARGATSVRSAVWQRANPRGGPTLQLELPPLRRQRLDFRVKIVPLAGDGVGTPSPSAVATPTPSPLPEPSPSPAP